MRVLANFPKTIVVDNSVADNPLAREIVSDFSGVEVLYVDRLDISGNFYSIAEGKRILHLTEYKGQFLKDCPGTAPPYLCCNYKILNQTTNCPLDCSYCILQGYLNNPLITICVNLDDLFGEVDEKLSKSPEKLFRIGTGELADSLAADPNFRVARRLIEFFRGRNNALLELKTKVANISGLLNQDHGGRIILSWSVNPDTLRLREEHKTAPVMERLKAAREASISGYKVGFHLDPVVIFNGCEEEYEQLIEMIFNYVEPDKIAWISMGSFRFPPELRDIIERRFPGSSIIYDEMVMGLDGKLRYIKPVRVEVYKRIYSKIREMDGDVFVYLCMESPDVWKKVMGWSPVSNDHLDYLFIDSLYRRFKGIVLARPMFFAF